MGPHVARGGGVLKGAVAAEVFSGHAVGHRSFVTILRGQRPAGAEGVNTGSSRDPLVARVRPEWGLTALEFTPTLRAGAWVPPLCSDFQGNPQVSSSSRACTC